MAKAGNILSLTLRPQPPSDLVVLGYTLTESPTINRAALPEVYRTEDVAWLYDELTHERVPGPPSWLTSADRAKGDGRATVTTHDILLSNGWEVRLRFRKIKVSRPQTLIPARHPGENDHEERLSRSA